MADREKVIEHLKEIAEYFRECMSNASFASKAENHFWELQNAAIEAAELLKAQEPRVMTMSELWHMEHKPVYLERKNSRLYTTEPSIVLKTERGYIPSLGDSYILMRENKIHDTYWACDYSKTWRCWTSRPTDEQRKATPWRD